MLPDTLRRDIHDTSSSEARPPLYSRHSALAELISEGQSGRNLIAPEGTRVDHQQGASHSPLHIVPYPDNAPFQNAVCPIENSTQAEIAIGAEWEANAEMDTLGFEGMHAFNPYRQVYASWVNELLL
jgi:hypothetical protein